MRNWIDHVDSQLSMFWTQKDILSGQLRLLRFMSALDSSARMMNTWSFPGSRHDSHIYTSSLFNRRFAEIQQINNIQYKTYADKGYYNDTHTVAAYHINIYTPIEHRNANNIMTQQRIGVEWGIGKMYVIYPLI